MALWGCAPPGMQAGIAADIAYSESLELAPASPCDQVPCTAVGSSLPPWAMLPTVEVQEEPPTETLAPLLRLSWCSCWPARWPASQQDEDRMDTHVKDKGPVQFADRPPGPACS